MLLEQRFVKDETKTVRDMIQAVNARTGENITVARFARFIVGEAPAEPPTRPDARVRSIPSESRRHGRIDASSIGRTRDVPGRSLSIEEHLMDAAIPYGPPLFRRVLLKLSGESFCRPGEGGISVDEVSRIARQASRVAAAASSSPSSSAAATSSAARR